MVDGGKLISFRYLLVRKVTWFMLPTTSAPLIFYPAQNKRCVWSRPRDKVNYICSRLPITSSLAFWLPEKVLFSLAMPASDIQLNTYNMDAYIICDLFSFLFCPSAGLVPVSRTHTASDISSNLERDKRPTWEKTRLSKIYCYIPVYWYLAWNTESTYIYSLQNTFNILVFSHTPR